MMNNPDNDMVLPSLFYFEIIDAIFSDLQETNPKLY